MPLLPGGERKKKPYRYVKSDINTRRWKDRVRPKKLKKDPFCEVWLYLGRHVIAEQVDHIIRRIDGGSLYNERNLMSISTFWHGKKTGIEGTLNLDTEKIRGGELVPRDREQIIKILIKRFENHY